MKSKIWLAMNYYGQPVLKITHYEDEDIKDSFLGRYLNQTQGSDESESFTYKSKVYLTLTNTGSGHDVKGNYNNYEIYPEKPLLEENITGSITNLKSKNIQEIPASATITDILRTVLYANGHGSEVILKPKNSFKTVKSEEEINHIVSSVNILDKGKTTRLADDYIQKLFNYEMITVRDHEDNPGSHHKLFNIILRRLDYEHNISIDAVTYEGNNLPKKTMFEFYDDKKFILRLNSKYIK